MPAWAPAGYPWVRHSLQQLRSSVTYRQGPLPLSSAAAWQGEGVAGAVSVRGRGWGTLLLDSRVRGLPETNLTIRLYNATPQERCSP